MITLLSSIVFLFVLYSLSRDDFVLLRRNVSLNTIFDSAFIVLLVGLFFSRLVYGLTHFSLSFFNPLVFFIIPYFPGITVSGFLLGSLLTLYLITKRRKLPLGKLFDLFALSLLPASSMYFVGQAVMLLIARNYLFALEQVGYAVFLVICFIVLLLLSQRSSWKDGLLTFVSVPLVILVTLMSQLVALHFQKIPVELPYDIGLFFVLFASFLIGLFRRAGQ